MNAQQILDVKQPEALFKNDSGMAKSRHAELMREWHPDRCSDAKASHVSAHINTLYKQAIERIKSGTWGDTSCVAFESAGVKHSYVCASRHDIDVGRVYGGRNIIYQISPEFRDLMGRGKDIVSHIRYSDAKMRHQFEPQVNSGEWHDGRNIVLANPAGDILLADVLDHAEIPAEHVAWIVSRLLNLRCFFNHVGIAHNGLSMHTLAINPGKHHVWVTGGWWYAAKLGQTMKALPAQLLPLLPKKVLDAKQADSIIDGEAIRLIARQIMPDNAPKAMKDWTKHPAGVNPVKDLEHWRTVVLSNSFGGIRFVKYGLSFEDVYGR